MPSIHNRFVFTSAVALGALVSLLGCASGLGKGSDGPAINEQLDAAFSVVGDNHVAVGRNSIGYLRARLVNAGNAEVTGSVSCEVSGGDPNGSVLRNNGAMVYDHGNELIARIRGGDDDAEFTVDCTAVDVGTITYTVTVGIPDLRGLYEVEMDLGVGSQVPDSVEDAMPFLACLKTIHEDPSSDCFVEELVNLASEESVWGSIAYGMAQVVCSLFAACDTAVGDMLNRVNTEILNVVPGELEEDIGELALLFDGISAEHRFISSLEIYDKQDRLEDDGNTYEVYSAKQWFSAAYCEGSAGYGRNEEHEDSRVEAESDERSDDFEVRLGIDGSDDVKGRVFFAEHEFKARYDEVSRRCLDYAMEQSDGGYASLYDYFQRKVCTRSSDITLCDSIVELMTAVVEDNLINNDAGESIRIKRGNANPDLGGGGRLLVSSFDDAKWDLDKPIEKDGVAFQAFRRGDAGEDGEGSNPSERGPCSGNDSPTDIGCGE